MSGPHKGHRRNGYGVRKESISEDYEDEPSPIRGNFIPVSIPTRSRSPSPKRKQPEEGVYIHLSLTNSQVDALATAFSPQLTPEDRSGNTSKEKAVESVQRRVRATKPVQMPRQRSRSPVKNDNPFYYSTSRARSKSPVKFVGLGKSLGEPRRTKFEFESTLASPISFHLPSPTKKAERQSSPENSALGDSSLSLAERRNRYTPGAIDTEMAQRYMNPKSKANGPRPRAVHVPIPSPARIEVIPPRTPSPKRNLMDPDNSESQYSVRIAPTSSSMLYISPLHIGRGSDSPEHPHVLQDYDNWKKAAAPTTLLDTPSDKYLSTKSTEWPKAIPPSLASPLPIIYSPLTPFFSTKDMPASKTASKVMIGDNGWLERTKVSPEKKPSPTKKSGFLDSLKKKAMEMVDMGELKAPRRNRDSDKERDITRSRLKLSLNPREQSLLYCELEFTLTNALNNYITSQFNAGFLDADKLKKVADGWLQKGRPNVVGFRYDLETQLELVRLHAAKFKFYGRSADTGNLVGNLEMMQVNARAIRVRTFCQPDTVIAKQLLDSQGLFNIMGCSTQEQIQLAEIVQFFKTVLERERYFQAKREARDSGDSGPVQPPLGDHGGQHGQQPEPLRGLSFDFDPMAE